MKARMPRSAAICFWYACVAAAIWLHNWWSLLLLALGLATYCAANSLGSDD